MGRGGDRRSKTPEQRRRDGSRERPRHKDKAQPKAPPGRPTRPQFTAAIATAAAVDPGAPPVSQEERDARVLAALHAQRMAHAAQEWDRLVGILEGEGRLTVSDGPWLESVAEAYAEMMAWRAAAALVPRTFVSATGDPKPHPEHQQARLALESYRKLLAEGGCTPQSRGRVGGAAGGDEEEDDFDTFQKKGDAIRRTR